MDHLNAEYDSLYLEDPRNPRWVAKPAVAYLWARTAECSNCRAEMPLLKTRVSFWQWAPSPGKSVTSGDEIDHCGYSAEWRESLVACLAPSLSRLADRCSTLATWTNDHDKIRGTFARFALPMVWDFAESCPLTDTTGGFGQAVEWIARVCSHAQQATAAAPPAIAMRQSAIDIQAGEFDVICTDPPYYDAIRYSDLMDFFHVWLRRALHGHSPETDAAFADPLGPKWDAEEERWRADR